MKDKIKKEEEDVDSLYAISEADPSSPQWIKLVGIVDEVQDAMKIPKDKRAKSIILNESAHTINGSANIGSGSITINIASMDLPDKELRALVAHEVKHLQQPRSFSGYKIPVLAAAGLGAAIDGIMIIKGMHSIVEPLLLVVSDAGLVGLSPLAKKAIDRHYEYDADKAALSVEPEGEMALRKRFHEIPPAEEEGAKQKNVKHTILHRVKRSLTADHPTDERRLNRGKKTIAAMETKNREGYER